MSMKKIALIGGGPAGLMAAEQLVGKGHEVHLFDAMPSLGRKFLMAGKSGMNLTHSEELEEFLKRYSDGAPVLEQAIREFSPEDIRNWAKDLGIETFIGSSGRIFPTDFKAAPLLRSWIKSLKIKGLQTHMRHRWMGWDKGELIFETPNGQTSFSADATLLGLGGVSWPKLGSDGNWQTALREREISLNEFKPSNCGFLVEWSTFFIEKFAGHPVKSIALKTELGYKKGDFVISKTGVEGSAIYTHSRALRLEIEQQVKAALHIDLTPDRSLEQLRTALQKPRGSKSISTHIKRATGLSGVKAALLRECLDKDRFSDMEKLAIGIKNLPLDLTAPRPIEEAISCAGGVAFDQLDENLMVKNHPGLFICGEMLDWDAPTGGYLLTACFASGKRAGNGAAKWLGSRP
ncbi:putative flavoprotein oxidoreductase [Candidatus Terasakiella magnetica]|uniref:Putative flavoprotein oxidoreductase n=1 Tax=Candidatus Terasakiella magnetica TaxID=1867952 RepID=A0A1C3RLT6_9PROT|nr:TIGR03862 family flavoprotein [Candidatus Terasakiella magnetica]SCA58254.1 putative flavoprotein oxidoreductase [Candidatus Terasakiella magnetica]